MLLGWKKTLRKEKRQLWKVRLQKLSNENLSLEEITALIENRFHFNETCVRVDREEVPVKSLDQAADVVAASLLYKNWQRPGAVVNATLSVEQQQTALDGVAKVVMEAVTDELYTIRQVQELQR